MMVTLRNLLRKPVTVQYPEQRVAQHHRFRGEDFVWYEERCTGCASCAKYCPLGIIKIVTAPSGEMTQEGEKYKLEVFDIEIARCMFCGLCVEACPYDALHMGSGFERARPEAVGPRHNRRRAEGVGQAAEHVVPPAVGGPRLRPFRAGRRREMAGRGPRAHCRADVR